MRMEQLPLLDIPAVPERRAKARFLSANADIMDCLLASETLKECAKTAAASVSKSHGDDRNTGLKFEDRLKALILSSENASKITSEVLTVAADRYPELSLVKAELIDGPDDKAIADLVLVVRSDRARTVKIAVNVKRLSPTISKTEGGSMLQYLQLALDDEYDPLAPPIPTGFDYERAVLEMLTCRRRIKDGRDFWLLVVRVSKGELHGIEAWGTMVHTAKGNTIVGRHSNRAVIIARKPDGTIGDADPNLLIAEQLLPKSNPSALRAQIVAAVLASDGRERATAAANRLLDMDDDKLLETVRTALGIWSEDLRGTLDA